LTKEREKDRLQTVAARGTKFEMRTNSSSIALEPMADFAYRQLVFSRHNHSRGEKNSSTG
jgi:hypothetical protein